ncbi:RimJ/RimL family protein N-acetyltransferase [Gelidibacter algens]|uniref:RimJ/RimL family protein N-acetyltransferase n=1 Tax=Gelidibacter algens TaxID=49280 RepID=A0A1A7QN96_9FLAO|nr:GNAT family protein [Gelidibacter algens]OBX20941.1 GNAT family acetyltransferase [Gelidibacter algens]RAJ25138.1 RimJ/RimL family protein N-acetyltransferase [Gelidibacter algens]
MIETEKLLLRPITMKDSQQVFSYRSDTETNKYQGFIPKELKEVDEFIAKNPLEFNQPESWFQLVIIEKSSKEIVGDIGIHFIGNDGFQCELGCTLSNKHQGKGFATDAMRITIDYLFNTLNKHRIIGSVDPNNLASIHLLQRLNFRKEAHFKESLLIDGHWVDDIVYGILKSEWEY